jgi:AraC-like DNA-binding protein
MMSPTTVASQHTFSVRLVRPFLAVLRGHPAFTADLLTPLESLPIDDRIPVTTVLELLRGAIAITGDEDLGLKAAREVRPGDFGALEYAACSTAIADDAMRMLERFIPLVNDALHTSREIQGDRVMFRFDSALVLSRAAEDFQLAAFHVMGQFRKPSGVNANVEIWFTHPEPSDLKEYRITFPDQALRFNAPYAGFSMDACALQVVLETADPKLHEVVKLYAETLLSQLPRAKSFTEGVRALIAGELAGGEPTTAVIARKLHVSTRTLARRLEEEGTSFKDVLDDLRFRMAQQYLGGQDLDIGEIAFMLGFSESSAFFRAFKRWTGQTPLAYRRERRG